MEKEVIPVVSNVLTAAATIFAVWVGNHLTYRRTTKERFWDLRRQAYGVILTELAAVDRISDSANKYIDSGVDNYWESDYFPRDVDEIGKHMRVACDRFSDDYLIFSDDFVSIFEGLLTELDDHDPNVAGYNEHLRYRRVVTKHRPLLLRQARNEISIQRTRRPFTNAMWVQRLWGWWQKNVSQRKPKHVDR